MSICLCKLLHVKMDSIKIGESESTWRSLENKHRYLTYVLSRKPYDKANLPWNDRISFSKIVYVQHLNQLCNIQCACLMTGMCSLLGNSIDWITGDDNSLPSANNRLIIYVIIIIITFLSIHVLIEQDDRYFWLNGAWFKLCIAWYPNSMGFLHVCYW